MARLAVRALIVPMLRLPHLLAILLLAVCGGFQGIVETSSEAAASETRPDLNDEASDPLDRVGSKSARYEQSHQAASEAELQAAEPDGSTDEAGLSAATFAGTTFSVVLTWHLPEQPPSVECATSKAPALTSKALPRGPPSIG